MSWRFHNGRVSDVAAHGPPNCWARTAPQGARQWQGGIGPAPRAWRRPVSGRKPIAGGVPARRRRHAPAVTPGVSCPGSNRRASR
jgi:hypothetical protein